MKHLGVAPGEQISVEKLPDGRVEVKAAPSGKDFGCLQLPEEAGSPSLVRGRDERDCCPRLDGSSPGPQEVKITADTNVLARILTGDDERQSRIAQNTLAQSDMVALTIPALCELVWVLARGYKIDVAEIAAAIRALINSANVIVSRPAAEAGLALLEAGSDFADGVIAFEGSQLGAETFVSFDTKAVSLVAKIGEAARLLG
jgi:predicted nucleic-acid-binding protein